jgi:hypothetical protein
VSTRRRVSPAETEQSKRASEAQAAELLAATVQKALQRHFEAQGKVLVRAVLKHNLLQEVWRLAPLVASGIRNEHRHKKAILASQPPPTEVEREAVHDLWKVLDDKYGSRVAPKGAKLRLLMQRHYNSEIASLERGSPQHERAAAKRAVMRKPLDVIRHLEQRVLNAQQMDDWLQRHGPDDARGG